MILDLEAAFGLGLGGFDDLDRERQVELLAWWRVKNPAPPKTTKKKQAHDRVRR